MFVRFKLSTYTQKYDKTDINKLNSVHHDWLIPSHHSVLIHWIGILMALKLHYFWGPVTSMHCSGP